MESLVKFHLDEASLKKHKLIAHCNIILTPNKVQHNAGKISLHLLSKGLPV